MRILIGFALLIGLLCQAEDKPKPPQITIEQQAEWLQARAELAEAQLQLKTAEARMNAVVKEIQAVCPAVIGKTGRPECPVKPPEPTK
jgi:hypothetical protein